MKGPKIITAQDIYSRRYLQILALFVQIAPLTHLLITVSAVSAWFSGVLHKWSLMHLHYLLGVSRNVVDPRNVRISSLGFHQSDSISVNLGSKYRKDDGYDDDDGDS